MGNLGLGISAALVGVFWTALNGLEVVAMKPNGIRVLVYVCLFLLGTGTAFGQLKFPDGSEQSTAGVTLVQTVVVSPAGTDTESGTALIDALAGITDAGAGKPYLVKIEPGLYDLGSSVLTMKEYVDIEGSGQGITQIKSTSSAGTGAVVAANFSELRGLSVWHAGGGSNATALYASGLSLFTMMHVQLLGSGGSANNFGAFMNNSTLRVRDCSLTGVGGTDASGIRITNGSAAFLKGSSVFAGSASSSNYGAYVDDSSLTARQCEFDGTTSSVILVGTGYALVAGSQIAEDPRFWITDINSPQPYAIVHCYNANFEAIPDDIAP